MPCIHKTRKHKVECTLKCEGLHIARSHDGGHEGLLMAYVREKDNLVRNLCHTTS